MVYSTNLQFIERSGLGIRVVDENLGSSTGGTASFDFSNDNIVSGSYSVAFANSNADYTELTENTDYVLDKESGRLVITSTGGATAGTATLYGTYWYSDNFSDDQITEMISSADSEIEKLTGRDWDSNSNTAVEYYDGRKASGYPTTDRPFVQDWDAPDFIVLNNHPVTKIDFVYFLSGVMDVSKFYNYDADLDTYTDKTSSVNDSSTAVFTLFASTPALNDVVYVGCSHRFLGLRSVLSTVGVGASVSIDWEYWNGSAWTDLTETDVDTGAKDFKASGKFTWAFPYDWSTTSVNSESYYWVRGVLNAGYTTAPVMASLTIEDAVGTVLEPRQYSFETWGKLNFVGTSVPDGTRNVRVDYSYGEGTTPAYIVDLSVVLAGLRAYINLSGGSYDDATSYSLGSKSLTIGEVYVNIREVIDQFKKRRDELLNLVGRRQNITVI